MEFLAFMNERKTVDRWFVLKIALIGALCGAVLAWIFALGGITI